MLTGMDKGMEIWGIVLIDLSVTPTDRYDR